MPSLLKSGSTSSSTRTSDGNSLLPNIDDEHAGDSSSDEEIEDVSGLEFTSLRALPRPVSATNVSSSDMQTDSGMEQTKSSTSVASPPCVYQCGGCRTIVSDGVVGQAVVRGVLNTIPLERMETGEKPMYKPLQCRRCMSPLGRYIDETFELDLEAVITTVLGKYHECAPSFEHLCVPYEKPAPPSAPDTAEPASKKRKPSTPANAEVKMTLAERVKMLEEFLVFHEKRIKFLESKNGIKLKV